MDDSQLDALAAEADDAASAGTPGAAPAPDAQPTPSPADELYGALDLLRLAVCQLKPRLADVWTDQAMRRIADAAPPVMARYGWSVGGFFERFGPEIALAVACAPVAIGTARVLRAERPIEAEPVTPADAAVPEAPTIGKPAG